MSTPPERHRQSSEQKLLSDEQVEKFYHDEFVADQVRHFRSLLGDSAREGVVADVGGGCGFFAKSLTDADGRRVRVIDRDPASIDACERAGIEALRSDALDPALRGDEQVATFNLILHHLVGDSESITVDLQKRALTAWQGRVRAVFVHEYIYESFVGNASGWLIFQITKSRILSALGRAVARFIPSLQANTFGVGVRFRAHDEWVRLFKQTGFEVKSCVIGENEPVSLARRLLLIKAIRRDSFLLTARSV